MSFPVDRRDERELPADYDGLIVTCDIDRTYLATRFSSLRSIAKIPFEFSVDKKGIWGMAALLKELRRGPGAISRHTPLYFVSASPNQLRPVIQRKMLLDGLEYDGTTFKNWGKVLLAGRPKRLKEQIGYKLTALLLARQSFPKAACDLLIGDDLETDPIAFALYADVLAGRIAGTQLTDVLMRQGVAPDDAAYIRQLAEQAGQVAPVRRILIRLERHEPEALRELAPWVAACRGAFQMACVAYAEGFISLDGVARVAASLVASGIPKSRLSDRLADAASRAMIETSLYGELCNGLSQRGVIDGGPAGSARVDPKWRQAANTTRQTWVPAAFFGQ